MSLYPNLNDIEEDENENIINSNDSDANHDVIPNYSLSFLCSLINCNFDGNRSQINTFLSNCDNATSLCSEENKRPLFAFILSRLTGSVRSQLYGKSYDNWEELKTILKRFYLDRKHYLQLMEELNQLRQNQNEPIIKFYERIDQLSTRLLNSLSFKNPTEHLGKIETIKELALSRLMYHSNSDISRFLRSQNITDINTAISKALEEERAISISRNEFKPRNSNNSFNQNNCNYCKRFGHNSNQCRKKLQDEKFNRPNNNNFQRNVYVTNETNNCAYCKKPGHSIVQCRKKQFDQNVKTNSQNQNNNNSQKFCNYCKNKGHLINECRKRDYNNSKKNNQHPSTSNITSSVNMCFNSAKSMGDNNKSPYIPAKNNVCNYCNKRGHFVISCLTRQFEERLEAKYGTSKYCKYCKKVGHTIIECHKLRYNNNKNGIKSCNYCKKQGHSIEDCRKREKVNYERTNNIHPVKTFLNGNHAINFNSSNTKSNLKTGSNLNYKNPQTNASSVVKFY